MANGPKISVSFGLCVYKEKDYVRRVYITNGNYLWVIIWLISNEHILREGADAVVVGML